MTKPLDRVIARCRCGQVEIEARGDAIASLICHCRDCQEGSSRLEVLPGAEKILDEQGGTAFALYRKDRLRYTAGAELLRPNKLETGSATNRTSASCCNSAMAMTFDDSRHWVPIFTRRLGAEAPPAEWRMCTKARPAGIALPEDVPSFGGLPLRLIKRLVGANLAMLLGR